MLTVPLLVQRLLPAMATALADFDLTALESDPESVYGLTRELTLGYLNPAWFRFAERNAGAESCVAWGLGAPLMAAIAEPLRASYEALFGSAARSGGAVEQTYLCPTPTRQREYRIRVLPLPSGVFLCHNTLVVESEHTDPAQPFGAAYLSEHGFVVQCANCRRLRHASDASRWDWVPALVETPHPQTSHGVCATCLGFFYPEVQ